MQTESNIIDVLNVLELHPELQENTSLYLAECPLDQTHYIVAEPSKNEWICSTCKESGNILDLQYQNSLAGLKRLNTSFVKEMEAFNELAGTSYTYNNISEVLLPGIDNEEQHKLMQKIVSIKETYIEDYRILDRYRLSVMVRDLNDGKELNDDIRRWWIKRY